MKENATKDLVQKEQARFATVGVPPGGQQRNRDGSVTHHTHDVGQDGTGRADERPHDGQQVVVEQEALGAQRPARVAVEHRDHHWHVGAADGRRQGDALPQTHTRTLVSVTTQQALFLFYKKRGKFAPVD